MLGLRASLRHLMMMPACSEPSLDGRSGFARAFASLRPNLRFQVAPKAGSSHFPFRKVLTRSAHSFYARDADILVFIQLDETGLGPGVTAAASACLVVTGTTGRARGARGAPRTYRSGCGAEPQRSAVGLSPKKPILTLHMVCNGNV